MLYNSIVDLDELILKCRNDTAKEHIDEAIKCYRVGAYRSSVISTWLAVFYDVLEKYKELCNIHGHEADLDSLVDVVDSSMNKLAHQEYMKYKKIYSDFEKNPTKENISAIMNFESTILEKIHKEFQFISYNEKIDLQRLKEDRNRCAHPSFDLNLNTFEPTAEVTRAHIRCAVESLLQYPATAGNHAIKNIIDELNSKYIPKERNALVSYMRDTPVLRLKSNTVRGLLSAIFDFSLQKEFSHRSRYIYFFDFIVELYPSEVEEFLKKDISQRLRRKITDEGDVILYRILYWVIWTRIAENFDANLLQKIRSYVLDLSITNTYRFDLVSHLFDHDNPQISSMGMEKIKLFNIDDYKKGSKYIQKGIILDRFIEIYITSDSFQNAKECYEVIGCNTVEFEWTEQQVKQFIFKGSQNYFVKNEGTGFGKGSFLRSIAILKSGNQFEESEIDDWLMKSESSDGSFL